MKTILMCLCGGGLFNTLEGEEFYADGQPMCSNRRVVAGVENGNTTTADVSKAVWPLS